MIDITRIGFFGDAREHEVYVRIDDECQQPHFHVRDIYTEADAAICLLSNQYCEHLNKETHSFKYGFLEQLNILLAEPCRSPHYADNYELEVEKWNMNNTADCSWHKGENGYSVILDYKQKIKLP